MTDATLTLAKISLNAFLREFCNEIKTKPDARYVFFLGAGCSRSSGILTGAEMAKEWLGTLYEREHGKRASNDADLDAWAEDQGYGSEFSKNPGAHYGKVFQALYRSPRLRQEEIERQLAKATFPSYGYSLLARIMCNDVMGPRCNVVLTTNFDDLMGDALYIYAGRNRKPRVIPHEALAHYVRASMARPLVVKLHGDALLTAQNTNQETDKIGEALQAAISPLLRDSGLIFLGYGGYDQSVLKALMALPKNTPARGVYWANKNLPPHDFQKWLCERDAQWVEAPKSEPEALYFDDLMMRLGRELKLAEPDWNWLEEIKNGYVESQQRLLPKEPSAAITSAEHPPQTSALRYAIAAFGYQKSNANRAEEIFKEGLKHHPDDALLLGAYANFLTDIRKDHDGAEAHYQRAIAADPQDANNLGNYALFLTDIRKDHDGAEAHYQRAIAANPQHANNLGNYGGFLLLRSRTDEGLSQLRAAVENLKTEAEDPLRAELALYGYAHAPAACRAGWLAFAKHCVDVLNASSPGWPLNEHAELAAATHPEPALLRDLAAVLMGEREASILRAHPAWQACLPQPEPPLDHGEARLVP